MTTLRIITSKIMKNFIKASSLILCVAFSSQGYAATVAKLLTDLTKEVQIVEVSGACKKTSTNETPPCPEIRATCPGNKVPVKFKSCSQTDNETTMTDLKVDVQGNSITCIPSAYNWYDETGGEGYAFEYNWDDDSVSPVALKYKVTARCITPIPDSVFKKIGITQ